MAINHLLADQICNKIEERAKEIIKQDANIKETLAERIKRYLILVERYVPKVKEIYTLNDFIEQHAYFKLIVNILEEIHTHSEEDIIGDELMVLLEPFKDMKKYIKDYLANNELPQ